jgi:hypothetical protein
MLCESSTYKVLFNFILVAIGDPVHVACLDGKLVLSVIVLVPVVEVLKLLHGLIGELNCRGFLSSNL